MRKDKKVGVLIVLQITSILVKNKQSIILECLINLRRLDFFPHLEMLHFVPKIHKELGYVFHCITSLSKDYSAQKLREQNLQKIFGDTCFEKIICLDTGEDKDRILTEYQDSGYLWIEDKVQNAECGLKYGLDSVLFEHGFNMDNEQFKKYPTWESIYEDLKSA